MNSCLDEKGLKREPNQSSYIKRGKRNAVERGLCLADRATMKATELLYTIISENE